MVKQQNGSAPQPRFASYAYEYNKSQNRDKILLILLVFVLYPAMMVANH